MNSGARLRSKYILNFAWLIPALFCVLKPYLSQAQVTISESYQEDKSAEESSLKDIIYQADIIQANLDNESALLKGNVVIMFDGYQLHAKQAEIFKKENRFTATGGVRIENVQTQISAEEVEIFFDTKQGHLKGARLVSGQMLFEADEIIKTGKETFEAKEATFTTCLTCPPSWRFKASKLKTNVNKYVDITHGYLQVVDQSVLWFPRLILPVNTRRKSGLIQPKPHISFSRKQADLEISYFWAIAENKDLTYTPKIYTKSGIKNIVNYRHLFSTDSRLELTAGFMRDHYYSEYDFTTNKESFTTENRWFIDYENSFTLPGNFIQKSRVKLVEDLLYLSDFPTEIDGHKESSLVNQVSLIKNKDSQHFSTEIVYNINLLTQDMRSKNLESVHKTPSIKYSVLSTPFLKQHFNFRLDNEYVKFSRKETSYDDIIPGGGAPGDPDKLAAPTPDGQYDPAQDLIRSGHRLILRPEISSSLNIGKTFRIVPEVRYHHAFYAFDPQTDISDPTAPYTNFANTGYLEGEINLQTQISKVFNSKWKHILEPKVTLIRGEILTQDDHIFFLSTRGMPYHRRFQPITDADFFAFEHGIQFDYKDRIYDTSIVQFSLLQSILRKNQNSGITYYDQPIYFDIWQSYDFLHAESAKPDPWSNLNALLKVKSKKIETFTSASHFHRLNRTNISTRNKFIYKPGHFLEGLYKNAYIVDGDNQITTHQEFVGAGLGWEFRYFHLSGNVLYSTLEKQLQGWNLRSIILPPGDCWEIYVNIYDNINRRNANRPEIDFQISWNFGDGTTLKRPKASSLQTY